MASRRQLKIGLILLGIVLLLGFLWLEPWAWIFGQPAVRISRQTTYLTEPVAADGMIDYVSAVNARCSAGVTPENNAFVPLARAFGPQHVPAAVVKRLGMDPLLNQGSYFQEARTLFASRIPPKGGRQPSLDSEELEWMLDEARERPWTDAEFPEVAQWLEANKQPLALISAASLRPRMYYPVIGANARPYLLTDVGVDSFIFVSAGNLLGTRGMHRIGVGETDAGLDDLLAGCRLAKRISVSSANLIDRLVGFRIADNFLRQIAAAAGSGKLTQPQIQKLQAELSAHPPDLDLARSIDEGERFTWLEAIASVPTVNVNYRGNGFQDSRGFFRTVGDLVDRAKIDRNESLIVVNECYDRLVAALREQDHALRHAELKKLLGDAAQRGATARSTSWFALIWMNRTARGRLNGDAAIYLLGGTFGALDSAQGDCEARYGLAQLCVALAAYRLDHAAYPQTLAELIPQYLPQLPKDPFGGKDFQYASQADGYRVYSIGRNEVDDGGVESDPQNNKDDIVAQIPRQPPPRPSELKAAEQQKKAAPEQDDASPRGGASQDK
ncbi:MAG TPA: type II secretion system protein GspG [Pirellulales bacterium]|jgi:hypothetical protein|nr:type II secretion system protein GspG [Pirellulales bacterium]